MQTPSFQGTHLFDRLCWAKENLDGVQSDYRVVYEDSVDECAKILVPDPNWIWRLVKEVNLVENLLWILSTFNKFKNYIKNKNTRREY